MTATATRISEAYASLVDMLFGDARVQAVFTRLREDDPRAWVITEPLTHAEDLEFYSIVGGVNEKFPDVWIIMHLIHAGKYENDLMDFIPPDAERQPLHRP